MRCAVSGSVYAQMPAPADATMTAIDNQKPTSDIWSRWLLQMRNGGDSNFERIIRSEVEEYVDRILGRAKFGTGMTGTLRDISRS